MLVEEAPHQVLDGRRRGDGPALLGRVAVVPRLQQALGGELARLVESQGHAMLAEGHAPVAAVRRPVLHHVRLHTASRHPETEAEQVAIPDKCVSARVYRDGAHQPERQPGPHRPPFRVSPA